MRVKGGRRPQCCVSWVGALRSAECFSCALCVHACNTRYNLSVRQSVGRPRLMVGCGRIEGSVLVESWPGESSPEVAGWNGSKARGKGERDRGKQARCITGTSGRIRQLSYSARKSQQEGAAVVARLGLATICARYWSRVASPVVPSSSVIENPRLFAEGCTLLSPRSSIDRPRRRAIYMTTYGRRRPSASGGRSVHSTTVAGRALVVDQSARLASPDVREPAIPCMLLAGLPERSASCLCFAECTLHASSRMAR